MDRIIIKGGVPLHGSIEVSGAKNAALPLMAASLLSKNPIVLSNVPHLADIATMGTLLGQHGVQMTMDGSEGRGGHGRTIKLQGNEITSTLAPYDIVRKMRASVLVLGPLLARKGEAKVSLPGGCAIGTRPIDIHLKALEQMGAKITLENGYVHATVPSRLKGAEINFEKVSVGATENILMAAALADGITVIKNAAREPEISDLAELLTKMGAKISGAGMDEITVEGVATLGGAEHRVIPDRIEIGTYAAAAAITGGEVEIIGNQIGAENILAKLGECGVKVQETNRGVKVSANGTLRHSEISTAPFPGFPTDMQAQFMALLSLAKGESHITENIFENRFMHVSELRRMGADITLNGNAAVVRGVASLEGAPVMATDLRASVSLVIAGLAARGETVINRVYHIDRGYERIEERLSKLGARIERRRET